MIYKNKIKQIILPILLLSVFVNSINGQTYEQQQKLQEYFDNNNKFFGFSKQVLDEVMSEHQDFFGSYADALIVIDIANKFANAQDKQALETIIIEGSKKGIEKLLPVLHKVLGWASWAKTGMELLDQFVVTPARIGNSLDFYFDLRDKGFEPGDVSWATKDYGQLRMTMMKEFRKQYGDEVFKEIRPSGLTLLPRWKPKFNGFLEAWIEAQYINYAVKKELDAILKSRTKEQSKGESKLLKWLEKKQKELDEDHECDKNEHWDIDDKSCECDDGYTENKAGDCIKVKQCDENEHWDASEGDCECDSGYTEDKYSDCIKVKDCDKNEHWDVDEGDCVCDDGYEEDENGVCVEDKEILVNIELTYPAGKSPRVFTKGWIFGAYATSKVGDDAEQDISSSVSWSGSGSFLPSQGSISRPSFSGSGRNTIILSVTIDGKSYKEKFKVRAVDPIRGRYAAIGSYAFCPADAHGCIADPHVVQGPIITGSPNVTVNGSPAARKGDTGVHAACCGANTFKIAEGDPKVLINGKPAARVGDKTEHCGGIGKIVDSPVDLTCGDNEKWTEDGCECEDGFERNDDDICVKIDEEHDCEDNEEWSDNDNACICKDGYTANKSGDCIEIKDCDKNEHFDVEEEDCVCDDGFTENNDGDCIKVKKCADNEHWDEGEGDCVCDDGFTKDDKGKCVPEEEIDEDICSIGYVKSLAQLINFLIAENKSNESALQSYISKFNKEINDQSSDPCNNSIIAYCYYNASEIAARMAENVSDIQDITIEIIILQFYCPDLEQKMQGAGITIKSLVSSISGLGMYKNKLAQMESRLGENGCDEDEVKDDGEKVVPPEGDPGFIQDGGISTEMPGDGDDNDGDGQQDEEVQGLSGYNVTLVLYDSGSAADDVFSLSVNGYGNLGQTPAGGLRSYGLNLLPRTYTAVVTVVLAPDDVGTYTLTVLYKGESIGSITGSPPQGSSASLTFTVPSEE